MIKRDVQEVKDDALGSVLEMVDAGKPYVHVQPGRELGQNHHGVVDVLFEAEERGKKVQG